MPGVRGPALAALLLVVGGPTAAARAQTLPSDPFVFGGGRLTVGGDVSATFSCAMDGAGRASGCGGDESGFFNYTDYERSALRQVRVDVSAALKAGDRLSVLGELRSENGDRPEAYALYARIRPWGERAFAVQIGRVPPTFGAFARRTYPSDNLLIGYPLAYQYLTSLRPDALPANADELLRMRGRGWLSSFSIGRTTPDRGLPLVSAFRWDTGIQLHAEHRLISGSLAVTSGTLSNPLVADDNGGKQVAGRVSLRPTPGLLLGASAARGPYLSQSVVDAAGAGGGSFTQTAWGADAEYSRDYYLVRFEAILSDWRLPTVGTPAIDRPLRALSSSLEGRYKLAPGLYVALRLDHLAFSEVAMGNVQEAWEAPVTRIEAGGGYALQRNLLLKIAYQYNTRASARTLRVHVAAAQLVYWL